MAVEIIKATLVPEQAAPRPVSNPASPAKGARATFVITFDRGERDTAGMLDTLRSRGYYAVADDRFPRTTIICRVAETTPASGIRAAVSDTLTDAGSAMVVELGGGAWIWPDKPWRGETNKSWRSVAD